LDYIHSRRIFVSYSCCHVHSTHRREDGEYKRELLEWWEILVDIYIFKDNATEYSALLTHNSSLTFFNYIWCTCISIIIPLNCILIKHNWLKRISDATEVTLSKTHTHTHTQRNERTSHIVIYNASFYFTWLLKNMEKYFFKW
jgi:hypothetical protein